MSGKFNISAGKLCRKLADRLSVMVYLLGLRCWLADWRTRDASAEVISCSAAAVPAVVRGVPDTAAVPRSQPVCMSMTKAVQGGDWSKVRPRRN